MQPTGDAAFDHERELFLIALERPPGAERSAYLDAVCGRDSPLRARLEDLIRQHASDSFLQDPLVPKSGTRQATVAAPVEGPGTRIGRYKLLQQIGEGGMGVVYMAEQEEPVRRRVALKIIKLGLDSRQVVARFEAERQALALMDHPNIARVLDGGATETGRPYFVMELVQGVPITEFCDKAKLRARDRLELFIHVCDAVQHAHQKGIIHRDIKPSNLLVTLHDGVPVPKVIDFGIAKATNQKLTEKTLFTQFATMIGTPAYMSPEQAEMSGLDIDTRTDIYALGVLLYELLTGSTPISEQRLRSLGFGEMQRVIREEEPERPSTRLRKTREAIELRLKDSRTVVRDVSTEIDVDLDWIVMKCLEKDRQRRYETTAGLAHDIRRHLNNEPVTARPPSASYRFRKLIRRNRTLALTTAVTVVALLGALTFSSVALVKERRARRQAAEAERAREQAREATKAETIRADTLSRFVVDFFGAALPSLEQQGHIEAISQLLAVSDRLASGLPDAPVAEATMRLAIGNGYNNELNTDLPAAAASYRVAENRALAAGSAGKQLANLARVRLLHTLLWSMDRDAALRLKELIEFGRACLRQVPPDTDAAAEALSDAAHFDTYFGGSVFNTAAGHSPEAEALARETLESTPADATHRPSRMRALNILAGQAAKRGATDEADELGRKFLEIGIQLDSGSLETQRDFQRFAGMLTSFGHYRPSTQLLAQTLARLNRRDTPLAMILRGNLGIATACSGDWLSGLRLLHETVTNRGCMAHHWYEATCLATLLHRDEMRRTLLTHGLARFGTGADPDGCRILAGGLLLGGVEDSALPIVRELVNRSLSGPPWTRNLARAQLSLLEYRTGSPEEALRVIQDFIHGNEGDRRVFYAELYGFAKLLRSAIEMKLGQTAAALDDYRAGDRLHSRALRAPGMPHPDLPSGASIASPRATELMRREAARLLGDAIPEDER